MQNNIKNAFLEGNINANVIGSKKEIVSDLKEQNNNLDKKIQELLKRGKDILGEENVKDLSELYNKLKEKEKKLDGEKRKEIKELLKEIKELLSELGKDVIDSYNERKIGNPDIKLLNKVDFKKSIVEFIGGDVSLKILKFSNVTIESFLRNFDKIKQVLEGKEFDKLSSDEKKQLEKKLEAIGYIPDGGRWDVIGYGELKIVMDTLNQILSNSDILNRIKILENLLILGVNPIWLERSKQVLKTIKDKDIFDWLGDYDGNGELTRDDKGIYSGQQLAEMFKRFEAMNSKVFYENLTNMLNSVSEDYGWGNVNIRNKTDFVNFLKAHPEAKYVLIKLYERLPVENLAMPSEQFNQYLEAERKAFESNKELVKLSNLIEKGLIEKFRKEMSNIEDSLNKALEKAKNPEDKEKIQFLLNKLKTPSGQTEIINKLKPNIMALTLSLVKGKEGVGLGANWSKQVNMIIDSVNFSIGAFAGKDGFTPGVVLSVNKNLKFGKNKENQINIVAGTAMGLVQFAGLTLSHLYGFKRLDTKLLFDYNRKLNKIGVSLGIFTVGWGISFEKGFDRIEAVHRNTERFAKLLDTLLKNDLRKTEINISNLADEFKIDQKDFDLMIKHIKQIVNMPGYKDVDWKILSSSIKEQYIRQFYDIQMTYLADYRNNEITGWRAGIAFIAGFFPIPFISPKITHYSRDFVEDRFDLLRDYSYISFADKQLYSEKLSVIAEKINAVFGNNIEVQITKNDTLVLKTKDGKSVLDEVNVYVSPDKITQVKINKDGSLEIGNVGKIYATFLAHGKGISNYLILGTDKIDGTIKITKEISKDLMDNKIAPIKEKIDLNKLSEQLPEEVMRRFIEKDGKIYFDVNGNSQIDSQDIDVTYGGYEISIDPDGKVQYKLLKDKKELIVNYYKVDKKTEIITLPKEVESIKKDFDSLWEERWIDLAKLRTKPEFKEFEKAKIEGDFTKAFSIGVNLLKKYVSFANELIKEVESVKEENKPYVVDVMDRFFRTDIEFSAKIHRYQLLNELINSKDFNLLTSKEKQVINLLLNGNIENAKKLAESIGYNKGDDNSIAIMFSYLDARLGEKGDKRAGDAFRSIFKQLYFAFSDHFGGEIFGKGHDRRVVFKEIFKNYGLAEKIVDDVLGKLKKQIDSSNIQSDLLENTVAFMAVGGIVDIGGKIESTGKGLHGQIPGMVEAIRGTEINVVDKGSKNKIVDLIMSNDFYKNGLKNFIQNLLEQVGFEGKISDELLKDVLTNGVIKLNNGYEIKIDRDFIAFAYDVCGNVAVGMRLNGINIYKEGQLQLKAEGIKFGMGAEGVMNIDPAKVMSLVVGVAWGKGEKNDENSPPKQTENNDENTTQGGGGEDNTDNNTNTNDNQNVP